MSGDMRVKLFLDLVNRLSPGAKAATRDLKSIKQAAGELKRENGGEALAQGLGRSGRAARSAERDLKAVRRASAEIRNERAGEGLAAGLRKVEPASRRAAQGLRTVKGEARALVGEKGPDQLAGGLDRAAGSAQRLRRELGSAKRAQQDLARNATAVVNLGGRDGAPPAGGQSGAGIGAAALAAGRTALMPLAAAYGGYRAVGAGVRGTVGQSISFEKAMAEVKKKVDGMDDPAALAKMEKNISKWAITYGRAREEVAALVAEAGAGGVTQAEMPEFARINLAASTAWDVTADKAGNALAKIRAATQWSNAGLEDFTDKVNALSDAGAAKEMDVVEMFQRSASAAKAAGVEFDASLAFLTAMNNIAIAPEVASRGFNAFAATLRTATEQKDVVDEGLKMLGMSAETVELGMKTNATQTMIEVLQRLEGHTDKAKAAIKIFGKQWWDEIARAGQALPEIRKNLEIVGNEDRWKGSAQKSLNIELATTDNHLKRLSALATDVGDRLGRWALPAINEGIERIIAGMDALDKRAEQKKEVENLAQAQAKGEALTPEQREKLAGDRQMALAVKRRSNQISAQSDYEETSARTAHAEPADVLDERRQLLRRQLQRQVDTLESEQRLAPGEFGLGKQKRLQALRNQLADIPAQAEEKRAAPLDPRRPADQAERGQADRGEAEAQRERVRQITSRVQVLDELGATVSNPADKKAFAGDAAAQRARLATAMRELVGQSAPPAVADAVAARQIAPNAAAAGAFGLNGPGGAPDRAAPKGPGPGLLSFGMNGAAGGDSGAAWASAVKSANDIDLGPAGMTMMERLNAGLKSGAAGAESTAAGVKTGIEAVLQGGDLSGAGASLMSTYAAGITAGGAQAVAAAQGVAGQVKAALAAGGGGSGSRGLSGSLHDGVD